MCSVNVFFDGSDNVIQLITCLSSWLKNPIHSFNTNFPNICLSYYLFDKYGRLHARYLIHAIAILIKIR